MSENKQLILIILAIVIIALISFLLSPFFKLNDVKIKGIHYLEKEDIVEVVSSYKKNNLWMIDKEDVKNKVKVYNYVKKVAVIKNYPNTLLIDIKERVPVGKINNNGSYLIFDENGYILEKGALSNRKIPLIKGIAYSFQKNKVIFADLFCQIVQALSSVSSEIRGDINNIICYQNKNKLKLNLRSKVEVNLGNTNNLNKKFKVLESTIKKIEDEKLAVNYIDLSIINKPVIKLQNK